MNKKLLLIMPPQLGLLKGFSTGLISLANYVSIHLPDLPIDILDLSATPESMLEAELLEHLLSWDEELAVGITATTASYQSALHVARIIKRFDPSSTVVLGGHHASADAETVLQYHQDIIDFIIVGEGEKPLLDLLIKLKQPEVFSVPGLAFFHNGKFYRNPSPSFLTQEELDSLKITFRGEWLFGTPGKFDHVTYVSARGCPLRCAFCSVANERIRAKSVPQVIRDIRDLTDRGFTRIAMEDNFFAHSAARTWELCEALIELREEGVQFSWDCQTRVESMARQGIAGLLASAGCEAVYIGVEALNADHLLYLNKTRTPQKYLEQLLRAVVPQLLDSPINCYLNLQLGLPGEEDRHIAATISALEELGMMALYKGKVITIFPQLHVVYPGTTHFYTGVTQGRFPKDIFETFTAWEGQQAPVVNWLGEHFAHGTGGLPEGMLNRELLWRGVYEVNVDTVFRISNALNAMDRIPGIRVFDYGVHLVSEAVNAREVVSPKDGKLIAQ